MSAERFFLDTNVIVYSFDSTAPSKQKKARLLIDRALGEQCGVLSWQVIQEFLNVALRKFRKPMGTEDAEEFLRQVLMPLCEVLPSSALYTQALELVSETGYSWYDCLILASAIDAGCKILYSEDLQAGRLVSGLKIVNPFT